MDKDYTIKIIHTHRMEYYLAIRKDEIRAFVTTWMGIENIMLSEISRTEKFKNDFTHMWDIKVKATNKQTRKTNK